MTQQKYNSHSSRARHEPTDEQLGQLMEKAALKVRESNKMSDAIFFRELRQASNEAKSRAAKSRNQ